MLVMVIINFLFFLIPFLFFIFLLMPGFLATHIVMRVENTGKMQNRHLHSLQHYDDDLHRKVENKFRNDRTYVEQ
jgi:hypothetical protein